MSNRGLLRRGPRTPSAPRVTTTRSPALCHRGLIDPSGSQHPAPDNRSISSVRPKRSTRTTDCERRVRGRSRSQTAEWWSLRMTEGPQRRFERLGLAEPHLIAERLGTEVQSRVKTTGAPPLRGDRRHREHARRWAFATDLAVLLDDALNTPRPAFRVGILGLSDEGLGTSRTSLCPLGRCRQWEVARETSDQRATISITSRTS